MWHPYDYDVIGWLGHALSAVGANPRSGWGIFAVGVAFFAGIPALVAALGQHLWADDTERLVLSWRRDVSASLGNGLLIPLTLVAANACYSETTSEVHAHLWRPILGTWAAGASGQTCAALCMVAALACTIAGVLADDGHRHRTQQIRYWDSPYTFRHLSNNQQPAWKLIIGWAVRMPSSLVHFTAQMALLTMTLKVMSINVSILQSTIGSVDMSLYSSNINFEYMGLGSLGRALVASYLFYALVAGSFLLMVASEYKTESLTKRRTAHRRRRLLIVCEAFVIVTILLSVWPLINIHHLMRAAIDALVLQRGASTDNSTLAGVAALRAYWVWPVDPWIIWTGLLALAGGILHTLVRGATVLLKGLLSDGSADQAAETARFVGSARSSAAKLPSEPRAQERQAGPRVAHRGAVPPIEAVSGDDNVGEVEGRAVGDYGVLYPVWFATNRMLDNNRGFTDARSDTVSRGKVLVHVPESHRFGETKGSLWQQLIHLDRRYGALRVQQVETRNRAAFYAELQAVLEAVKAAGQEPQALVFLHGYNVGFAEAAIRAAQLGVDLGMQGATAFFSWPSLNDLKAYTGDEAAIEGSERAIKDFIVDFAINCGAARVHILAHSMGNRGLLRALQRIASDAAAHSPVAFGQIFLAAPDVDRDLFMDLAQLYPTYSERTTLYASGRDLPLWVSKFVHGAPRAGYFEPYTVVPGIDTVAVPHFDVDKLGHSYYAAAEALLNDMHELMHHGTAPGHRQRIEPVAADGASFWRLRQ